MDYWLQTKRNSDEGYAQKRFNSETADSQFQRDRARIIHSAAFRRLQSKTQVLGLGDSDFYRTRLTHSLEVAQIGSGICESLKEKYIDNDVYKWIPSLSLIESIGLCHDIGHPPFGHGGEVALNYSMLNFGGFEGNGQTLRIASKLGEYSPDHGMDLTRRTQLGLIKYPSSYSELINYKSPKKELSKISIDYSHPPKCFLDDELGVFKWIFEGVDKSDAKKFTTIKENKGEHSDCIFKSFDTSIMELADDISYGVHDLEDALALRLVTFKMWETDVLDKICHLKNNVIVDNIDFYNAKLFSGSGKERKHAISKLIGYFISNVSVKTIDGFKTDLLKYNACVEADVEIILKALKKFIFVRVIKSPEVQILEYKGQQIVLKLFEVLNSNPSRLLPKNTLELYEKSENKERIICDYVSGMTDTYATKLYHKLYTPNIGSVFDRM
ncbi:anti-phage deoxyguanosine triphosphatase [Agarivorans sp. 1_MG-2023]|uniref:anti-phage deoxyguanosine triphosphatase n=1 Tax=Agarivorans sp. 1_MG-2023 TaxID=3062634 RepID=UPI0026E35777|nr:anti-phage deoxyguanosine triphosphatase [Agarivorans sp. 1_MG-2023]MDO6762597.1 anti-phage deoxyguanosine triphosphatase [Agarivorans sp. 1_MG-2023]